MLLLLYFFGPVRMAFLAGLFSLLYHNFPSGVSPLFLAHRTDPPFFDAGFRLCRVGGTIRIPPPEFEDNPISDVAFFFVHQLDTIGFGSAFVHVFRSLDDRPAYGMPFVGAKEALGL